MTLFLRFCWLLPLTLVALFSLWGAFMSVVWLFSPAVPVFGRLLAIVSAAAYGAIVYAGYRAWKITVLALRGQAELSRSRNLYGALAALAALLLLFAVAYPKFQELMRYSAGGRQKGDLYLIREQLEEYKRAHGQYPAGPEEVGVIVSSCSPRGLWQDKLFPHPPSGEVEYYPSAGDRDSGNWAYVNDPASPDFGRFYIDCRHPEQNWARPWSSF